MKIKKSLIGNIIFGIKKQKLPSCYCGCGKDVTRVGNRFINGHNRPVLGRKHSNESKLKMSNILKSKEVREKYKQTCLEKYGVQHPLQAKEIQEKYKQTCLEKYGVTSPAQSKEIQQKFKNTCLKKYGVENPSQLIEIKEKKKQICLDHCGVEYPVQLKEVQEKRKSTCLKRYGETSNLKCQKNKDKIKETCLKKYGVDHPMKFEKIQEKLKQIFLEKYGESTNLKCQETKNKIKQTLLKKYGVDNWAKTTQGKQLARINAGKRVETQRLNGEPLSPRIGDLERPCLNELSIHIEYKIIRQDHSIFDLVAFFPDGHIPELKLFIEFDEGHHFEDKKEMTILKQKDVDRQLVLESIPGYKVFRISEKDWIANQEQVISNFKQLTEVKPEVGVENASSQQDVDFQSKVEEEQYST